MAKEMERFGGQTSAFGNLSGSFLQGPGLSLGASTMNMSAAAVAPGQTIYVYGPNGELIPKDQAQ